MVKCCRELEKFDKHELLVRVYFPSMIGSGFQLKIVRLRYRWSLLEKYSCKASKLHLKPRRFKIFIETLVSLGNQYSLNNVLYVKLYYFGNFDFFIFHEGEPTLERSEEG